MGEGLSSRPSARWRAPVRQRAAPALPAVDWRRHRRRIDRLRGRPYNLDLDRRADYTEAAGWTVDHHETALPPEPPGPPLPAGDAGASWAAACRIVRDYTFPDPGLVVGLFPPDEPVDGRPLLLRARFLGLTFWLGARTGPEIRETQASDDRPVRVWGLSYATLDGHLERGEIRFTVHKAERTGAVSFHIDAVSRVDRIPNPLVRIGFAVFGRRLQLRFARTSLDRMRRLVEADLAARSSSRSESGGAVRADLVPP